MYACQCILFLYYLMYNIISVYKFIIILANSTKICAMISGNSVYKFIIILANSTKICAMISGNEEIKEFFRTKTTGVAKTVEVNRRPV